MKRRVGLINVWQEMHGAGELRRRRRRQRAKSPEYFPCQNRWMGAREKRRNGWQQGLLRHTWTAECESTLPIDPTRWASGIVRLLCGCSKGGGGQLETGLPRRPPLARRNAALSLSLFLELAFQRVVPVRKVVCMRARSPAYTIATVQSLHCREGERQTALGEGPSLLSPPEYRSHV